MIIEPAPIPEFAVLGHPNEGKSSLVSTLTEDDSVKISSYPGETTECRIFPVTIDGIEIIRFTDTPGFQVPRQTLSWFEKYTGPQENMVQDFIIENRDNPTFKDEVELLSPIGRGAGIIYVANGSRPLRSNDRAEMEILSLIKRPRIGIINNKTDENRFNPEWEQAFASHFDKVIYFNAHLASYRERLFLLEQLGTIDQRLQETLSRVIKAFKDDWSHRNALTSEIILNLIETCLTHTVKKTIRDASRKTSDKKQLIEQWNKDISSFEKDAYQRIRSLFKHNIFNIMLPGHSILSKELFDSETWKVLGLTKVQLATTAATIGGATAAILDIAVAGHSLGLFALLGGVAGAGSALLGANQIARVKVMGKTLGGFKVKVGPHHNVLFMSILLDRALLFYTHVINWAHGKRDTETSMAPGISPDEKSMSYTAHWPQDVRNDFLTFFSALKSKDPEKKETAKKSVLKTLKNILNSLPLGS
ncbi:MAG: GTPase/DUF3482 domain-containing protein [Proteobacteria bacterium]|nr:GTPase/DUF3482 domain-containing protein [Pseudomonadota bacterium]